MIKKFVLAIVCLILVSLVAAQTQTISIGGVQRPVTGVPLYDYVGTRDPNFAWREIGTLDGLGWKGTLLNVTSQQWLTPEETENSLWSHLLLVIRPWSVQNEELGALYVGGSSNSKQTVSLTDIEVMVGSVMAVDAQVTTGVLFQVPNQGIVMKNDPELKSRKEDDFVAYTWKKFTENPSRPDATAYFPMVKSVVAALDAITEFSEAKVAAGEWDKAVKKFYLTGLSKRAATTWFAAAYEGSRPAAERRIVGAAPIAFDTLNFSVVVPKMFEYYGGWTFAFKDYHKQGITGMIGTPAMDLLSSVVDPLYPAYAPGLANVEVLYVSTSGDEFFDLSNDRYWWNALSSTKKYRYIAPNTEHTTYTGIVGILQSIVKHLDAIASQRKRPTLNWNFDSYGKLTFTTDVLPLSVKIYRAETLQTTPRRRDFRLVVAKPESGCQFPQVEIDAETCANPVLWFSNPFVIPIYKNGKWVYTYTEKVSSTSPNWVGYYLMATYADGQVYTTQANVLPDVNPYPPCGAGDACIGTLV